MCVSVFVRTDHRSALSGKYIPDNILPFDYLTLAKGAKLTDIMTSPLSYNGFLISKKLKNLFEKEGVKDGRYYSVVLFNKDKEVKDYFYFHSASCLRNYVDYSKSVFVVEQLQGVTKYKLPTCTTYEELKSFEAKTDMMELVVAKHLYLRPNFPFSQPLFRIHAFNRDFFITKKLKEMMESNKITGMRILSSKDLINTPNLS